MTSKRWLRKRLVHTCTIERDNGTAQSSTGQVTASWADVGTAVECRFYERVEDIPSEVLGRITVRDRAIILDASENIAVNDRIYNILDKDGSTIEADRYKVERLVSPRGITGDIYYRLASLEKVEIT